jgi:hypothetical protein
MNLSFPTRYQGLKTCRVSIAATTTVLTRQGWLGKQVGMSRGDGGGLFWGSFKVGHVEVA